MNEEIHTYAAGMTPAGIPHLGRAAEETVIPVQMEGPLQITYTNPEDDPKIN